MLHWFLFMFVSYIKIQLSGTYHKNIVVWNISYVYIDGFTFCQIVLKNRTMVLPIVKLFYNKETQYKKRKKRKMFQHDKYIQKLFQKQQRNHSVDLHKIWMVVVPTCYEIYTDYLKLLFSFYCMLYYAHTSRVQCPYYLKI